MLGTLASAHDRFHVSNSRGDYQRTSGIPTTVTVDGKEKEIKSTGFDLTKEESRLLYDNGVTADRKFLDKWDFAQWVSNYRTPQG